MDIEDAALISDANAIIRHGNTVERLLRLARSTAPKPEKTIIHVAKIEILEGGFFSEGTLTIITLSDGRLIYMTARHVGDGVRLLDYVGGDGDVCFYLGRSSVLHLPPGMQPSDVDLFDVHLIGQMDAIMAFKASCPRLMDIPNIDRVSYGFPAGTSDKRGDRPVMRSYEHYVDADDQGLRWVHSSALNVGGESGSGVGIEVDGKFKVHGCLAATSLFTRGPEDKPPFYALVQMLHRDMNLIQIE